MNVKREFFNSLTAQMFLSVILSAQNFWFIVMLLAMLTIILLSLLMCIFILINKVVVLSEKKNWKDFVSL